MRNSNKQLCLLLGLAIVFCGAFAATKSSRVANLLQAKADFIPNRCTVDDMGPCKELWNGGGKYPACVCFSDGTCEFRDDKTRCQWCAEEEAASVNEGEKCPDLKKGLLHVCPIKYPADAIGVIEPDPNVDPIPYNPDTDPACDEPEYHILPVEPEYHILPVEPEYHILPVEPEYHILPVEPEYHILPIYEPENEIQPVRPTIRPLPIYEPIKLIEQPELTVDPITVQPIRPTIRPLPISEPVMLEPAVLPAVEPITIEPAVLKPAVEPITVEPISVEPAVIKPAVRPILVKPAVEPEISLYPAVEPAVDVQPISASIKIDPSTDPILVTQTAKKGKSGAKKAAKPEKVKATQGCVCTDDGVCTRQKIVDWKSTCEGDNVVAVVDDGACPKSSKCVLKAPKDAHKCTKEERANTGRMCPMFLSLNGCICYKDGHCVNQGTNACMNCQNADIVSVSSQNCDCV